MNGSSVTARNMLKTVPSKALARVSVCLLAGTEEPFTICSRGSLCQEHLQKLGKREEFRVQRSEFSVVGCIPEGA